MGRTLALLFSMILLFNYVKEGYAQQPEQRPEKISQETLNKCVELGVVITIVAFAKNDALIQGKNKPVFHNEIGGFGGVGNKSSLKDKVRGYSISSRLKKLVTKSDIYEDPDTLLILVLKDPCCWWYYRKDGITIGIEAEWESPLRTPKGCEILEFRKGEIGLIKGEIFIREGTQLRIRDHPDDTYTFTKGRWLKNLVDHLKEKQ